MSALVAADLLKLRRRRGLWLTTLFLPSFFVVLITVLSVAGAIDGDGGATFVEDFAIAMNTFCVVLTVLVGARLGSEERATGTLRYQLLTGTPRHLLYLSKIATLVLTCLLLTLISVATITMGSLAVPQGAGEPTAAADVVDALWNVLLPALCYGTIAFGVGALVGSTGPAIATALVLNLVGINVLYALTLIDDSFRHAVLNLGVDRLTVDEADADDRVAFGAAIAMVVGWIGTFLGAGWLRLRRIEA